MNITPLHILLVEHMPEERVSIRRLLTHPVFAGTTITEAAPGDAVLAICQATPPDCVLLAYHPPAEESIATLVALRAQSDVPVVLLARADAEELAVAALSYGAQDYLITATLTPVRLAHTIRQAISVVEMSRLHDQVLHTHTTMLEECPLEEQWLHLALAAAHLNAWEWDIATGTVTFAAQKEQVCNIASGYQTCTIADIRATVYPPDLPAYEQAVMDALQHESSYQLQVRVYANEGPLRWIELCASVQHDATGRPVRVVGVTRDISAEKRRAATRTLHDTISRVLGIPRDEAATLQTLATLPLPTLADACAIYLLDEDDALRPAVAYAGTPPRLVPPCRLPAAVAWDGVPDLPGEVLCSGTPRFLTALPNDHVLVIDSCILHTALLVPLIAQNDRLGVLLLGRTGDEEPYDNDDLALAMALARRGAEALVQARLQAMAQAARQAAAEAHALLAALVASAPNGIAYLDHELRYQLINPALAAMNGCPPVAHLGHTPGEVLPPGSGTQIELLLRQVMTTGTPLHDLEVPGQATMLESPPRDWLISSFPVPGPAGEVAGVGVIVTDITERKLAEEALKAHAEALSRTNAELARTLRLKDEFLAMMSHELRTPLNIMLGVSEALETEIYGPVEERQRKAINTIIRSGRQLLAIFTDILDLTHLAAGKVVLDLQPVDVELLCYSALQFVRDTARHKDIQLQGVVAEGVTGLVADERRLTQILVNLLDNAVKFTPAGGTVGVEVIGEPAQERISFAVWDTGIGIAAADYSRLFQPFTQVDGGLTRAYGGVGLGLTLVRKLVELHGGSVSLESAPGQGSRFTVYLPWSDAENVAPPATPAPAPWPEVWEQPPRLVIADDHEPTLAFYADLLGRQGCTVTVARTGLEALAQVREQHPDVVILDIQMTELDGLEVIRRMRTDNRLVGMRIIALTALAMPGDRERCLEAGADAYLARPVNLRTLLATITMLLQTG